MTEKAKTEGYSGTPLAKKLGISEGRTVFTAGAPKSYERLLAPIPPRVRFVTKVTSDTDIVHLFVTRREELTERLGWLREAIRPDAVIWVSWPKKKAKAPTDLNEDVIREVALPLGLVDVKVCAIDETWSGLKLVIRKALRSSGREEGLRVELLDKGLSGGGQMSGDLPRTARGLKPGAGRRGLTWEQFTAAALRLPGMEEGTSYSTPAVFVRKKLVARLKEDGETVAVRVDFLDRDLLLEADPEAFYLTDHYRAYPWILMRLGAVRTPVALRLLDQAWRLAAPAARSGKRAGKAMSGSKSGTARPRAAGARAGQGRRRSK